MVVILGGSSLTAPGWRVRTAGLETPLLPPSDAAAWFQIPNDARTDWHAVEIFKPGFAISYSFQIQVRSPAIVCLGTVHQDFSRVVSRDDPTVPGEVVHIFLSGLQGMEVVANAEWMEPFGGWVG